VDGEQAGNFVRRKNKKQKNKKEEGRLIMASKKDGIKPGWQSTEFILSTLVALLGIAVAGGFVDLDNAYSLSRGRVKAAAEENK
jgi:hypothetical protein